MINRDPTAWILGAKKKIIKFIHAYNTWPFGRVQTSW